MDDEKLIVRPKRINGDDGYRVFSVRIKEEVVSQIDDIAKRTGRSRNELIGMFLEYAVVRCEITE